MSAATSGGYIPEERGFFDSGLLRFQLRRQGTAQLRMRGQSMSPLLPPGTRATLRPMKPAESLRGAIVAVDRGERVVVHRVAVADGTKIVTRGLSARLPDPVSERSAVIGVVCAGGSPYLTERTLQIAATAITLSIRGLRILRGRW